MTVISNSQKRKIRKFFKCATQKKRASTRDALDVHHVDMRALQCKGRRSAVHCFMETMGKVINQALDRLPPSASAVELQRALMVEMPKWEHRFRRTLKKKCGIRLPTPPQPQPPTMITYDVVLL